jgi:peptidoglycan L-alanyl-D-glutamate endopeptidase CwlK
VKNSRSLEDLHPGVRRRVEAFLNAAKGAGIDLLVTSTYRDFEAQQALYDQGRSKPGKIVTNAKPGQSYHNFRCAVDVVPMRGGKPVWSDKDPVWQTVGELGEAAGLEWAGRWTKFKEYPHFQYTAGATLKQLAEGWQPA